MALPIKETPVLTGKSADRFLRIVEENEKKTISDEERKTMRESVRAFKAGLKTDDFSNKFAT